MDQTDQPHFDNYKCKGADESLPHPDDIDAVSEYFGPGGIAEGKPYFDEDWIRTYPDGRMTAHRSCPDLNCPFHTGEDKIDPMELEACECAQHDCPCCNGVPFSIRMLQKPPQHLE